MGQWVMLFSKLKRDLVGVAKASVKSALVKWHIPEAKWANHEQAENELKPYLRAEPVHVAKCWDDLWLGVKG